MAVLALDHVAAVAGVPHEGVVPGAAGQHVAALAADEDVVAGTAQQRVRALAAGDGVVAGPAVHGQLDHPRGQSGTAHRVVAAECVHDEPVVGPLGALDRDGGRQTDHRVTGPAAGDLDDVIAVGAVDGDGVGLAVAGAAAGGDGEVDVHGGDGGAGQVVDGDGVGAAEGDDVDLLDAVGVHGHGADVAGQPQPAAVGGQVDVLVDAGAVELQGVVAVLALDHVAAVAGVPHEGVVPGAAGQHVAALAADEDVVAGAAGQPVVAVAAGYRVVAVAAVHGDVDQRRQTVAGREGVVAPVHVDGQVLTGPDVDGEGGRADAVKADARAVGRDGEGFGRVAAVDLDGVAAVAALVEVGPVAGVPDHPVVPRLAEHLVGAGAARQGVIAVAPEELVVAPLAQQRIVAGLPEELVVARPARERVVAVAAEQDRGRQCPVGLVERNLVVAGLAEHLDERGVGDRRRTALNHDGAAVDEDLPRDVPANDDRIVLGVADDRQDARARRKRGRDRRENAWVEGLAGRQEAARMGPFPARMRNPTGLFLEHAMQPRHDHGNTSGERKRRKRHPHGRGAISCSPALRQRFGAPVSTVRSRPPGRSPDGPALDAENRAATPTPESGAAPARGPSRRRSGAAAFRSGCDRVVRRWSIPLRRGTGRWAAFGRSEFPPRATQGLGADGPLRVVCLA